jgi:hypothetical protein
MQQGLFDMFWIQNCSGDHTAREYREEDDVEEENDQPDGMQAMELMWCLGQGDRQTAGGHGAEEPGESEVFNAVAEADFALGLFLWF